MIPHRHIPCHLSPRPDLLRLPDEDWCDWPPSAAPPAWLAELPVERGPKALRLPSAGEMLQARARRMAEVGR